MAESAGSALIYIPAAVDPATLFAGRTLLDRALALAAAAALEPRLVGCEPGHPLPSPVGRTTLRAGARLVAPDGLVLLLRCDVGCVAGALRDLATGVAVEAVAYDDAGRVALVRTTVAALGGIVPPDLERAARGLTIAPRPGWLGSRRIVALDAVATPGGRKRAETDLLSALDNPRDGIVDRVLNRHLSRPLSRALLSLRVTPNQITIVALLLAFVAAAALAQPGIATPVLGALLLQLTAVLDCVDGEIARAKVLETEWGEWLDIASDTLIHVATFLGIAVHAWPELGSETAKWLGGVFAFGGLASFVVVTRAEKTEQRWQASGGWQGRLLATLLGTLTTRDSSVLVLIVAASGLQASFLAAAAFAAQLFWVGTLVLHTSAMRQAE